MSFEIVMADEAILLPLTGALRLGWIAAPCPVRWAKPADLDGVVDQQSVVLVSPLAYARLAVTHVILSDVAVATEPRGAVALASERRPDELGDVEIDTRDASPTAEALASILRIQHFGAGGRWQMTRTPALAPPARLLEGDAALPALVAAETAARQRAALQVATERASGVATPGDEDDEAEAEAAAPSGHVEDLARAWFVLTGLPWVSHLLLAPRSLALDRPADLAAVVEVFHDSLRRGREQEAALVAEAAARLGLPSQPVRELFRMAHYTLGPRDQQALTTFYQRAARFAGLPAVPEPRIVAVGEE